MKAYLLIEISWRSLRHSRLTHWDGTQAPELSEAPRGIPTCRHIWEPPGSGDEPPPTLHQGTKAGRNQAGSALGGGDPPKAGRFLDSQNLRGAQMQPGFRVQERSSPWFEKRTTPLSLSFLLCTMGIITPAHWKCQRNIGEDGGG